MKVILLVLVAATAVLAKQLPSENTAFGYLTKFGIPEAEKIRKAEEEYLNSQSRIVGGSAAEQNQIPYQVQWWFFLHQIFLALNVSHFYFNS